MKILARPGYMFPLLFLLTLTLTLALWQGCQQQGNQPTSPLTDQGTMHMLSKQDPQVRAAIAVQERNTDKLLRNADISGTGIGAGSDGKPVIVVFTRKSAASVPASLEGVPTRVENVGDVYAMSFTKQYNPIPCGVSTGNNNECAAGTIGCLVTDGTTTYMLSNNHVFARENAASIGEVIDQPGRYDAKPKCGAARQAATLYAFNTISFSSNNTIDAALAIFKSGVTFTPWMVSNYYKPVGPAVAPSVGLAVKKVGRTSGLTTGTIGAINVTIQVGYTSGTATFVNQIYVPGTFIRSGDSGSVMVTQSGNAVVGLDFAGGSNSSFANPISDVLSYFGVTVAP